MRKIILCSFFPRKLKINLIKMKFAEILNNHNILQQ